MLFGSVMTYCPLYQVKNYIFAKIKYKLSARTRARTREGLHATDSIAPVQSARRAKMSARKRFPLILATSGV